MQDLYVGQVNAPCLEEEVASLHAQHATALLRYARSIIGNDETAREGLQETFLRYFIERSYGRQILYPKAWLFGVLRNYLYDRATAVSLLREISFEHAETKPDLSPSPEQLAGGMQTAKQIANSLSERELQCLRLRTEGLSYGEIGVAMQVRVGTVGALLARAHDKIRRFADGDRGGRMVAAALFHLVQEGPAAL
jgi:RNA polymerase sigma-70 factor (ECF subfamily)